MRAWLDPCYKPNVKPNARAAVQNLAAQLIELARTHQAEALGARLALMPLRDILGVRSTLLETGEHAALVDGLLEGVQHPNPRVRFNAATALDHLADERCTEPLRRLLDDPVPRVRRAALHSVSCDACKLEPMPKGDDLIGVLVARATHDPSVRVRRVAVDSLADCPDAQATATLEALVVSETDVGVQRRARRVLARTSSLRV